MSDINELKEHRGSAFHSVLVAAGGAEVAVAEERDELELAATGTAVHGATKGRLSTGNHLIDIFYFGIPGVESIYNFFIMVCKKFLKDVLKTIAQENDTKSPLIFLMNGPGS